MKYNKIGIEASEQDRVFAEELNGSVQNIYYVLTYNNCMYDPRGSDSHRENNLNLKLKKTSKKTFTYYIEYLQTKNPIFLRRAERSFINE